MLTTTFLLIALTKQVNLTPPHKTNFTVEAGRVLAAGFDKVTLKPSELPGCATVDEVAKEAFEKYQCKWKWDCGSNYFPAAPGVYEPGCKAYIDCGGLECSDDGKSVKVNPAEGWLSVSSCAAVKCASASCIGNPADRPALPTGAKFDTCESVSGYLHKDGKWNGNYLHDEFARNLPGKEDWGSLVPNPWAPNKQVNAYCVVKRDTEKCSAVDSGYTSVLNQRTRFRASSQFKYAEDEEEAPADPSQTCVDSPKPWNTPKPEISGKKQYRQWGFTGLIAKTEVAEWSIEAEFEDGCAALASALGYEGAAATAYCAADSGNDAVRPNYWWVKNVKKVSAKGKKSFKLTDFYGTASGSKEIAGIDNDLEVVYGYKTAPNPNPLTLLTTNFYGSANAGTFAEYKCKYSDGGKNTLGIGGAIGICVAVSVVLCLVTALILYFVCIKAAKNPVQSP
jgi:hypothetical protein